MAWRIRDCIVGRSSIILSGSGFNIIIIIIIIITTATAWAIIIIIVTISITTTTTITTAGRCSWGGEGGRARGRFPKPTLALRPPARI